MDGNQRWDNGYTKNSAKKEEKSRIPKEFYLLKVGNLVKETHPYDPRPRHIYT
jgi:hypothetical protein